MKRFLLFMLAVGVSVSAPSSLQLSEVAFAQAKKGEGATAASAPDDDAPASEAQTLYQEAEGYARRKFDEFKKNAVPYDRQLEQKTFQEQKDLALRNAERLAARGPLAGLDLYYSGLLYVLAGRSEPALDSLRGFIAGEAGATEVLRQRARALVVEHAAKLDRHEEAERFLRDYTGREPRTANDLHRLNYVMASLYSKRKDYARAASYAQTAYASALEVARAPSLAPTRRDTVIYGAGSFLAETLLSANRRPEALAVIQEMRSLSLSLPSARLYGQATELLLRQGGEFGPPPTLAGVEPVASPEIKVAETIGRGPVRLADLRGKVVFLDFWATWCTYCVQTMPRLNALHQKYKDRGLVILGLNEFEGHVQGREATRAEELEYFRQFKRRMNVAYDFAVAADAENDRLYGVESLPTGVLIDRRGRVRFLTIGASQEEAELLKKMVVKLLDEAP